MLATSAMLSLFSVGSVTRKPHGNWWSTGDSEKCRQEKVECNAEEWSSLSIVAGRRVEFRRGRLRVQSCPTRIGSYWKSERVHQQLGSELSENSSFSIEQISETGQPRALDPSTPRQRGFFSFRLSECCLQIMCRP